VFQSLWEVLTAYWPWLLLIAGVSYLLGSFNFAILVTRVMAGKDIRDMGSGNAGMTNVLRSQGKRAAAWTTLGDLAKSIAATLLGGYLFHLAGGEVLEDGMRWVVGRYLAGLFCMLGHMFPLYFGFRGGKGVLTTLGIMLVVDWQSALIGFTVFLIVVFITRMVSLGSIIGVTTVTLLTWIFDRFVRGWNTNYVTFCTAATALLAAIVIWMHRGNIKRILNGTERKISLSKKKERNDG